MGWDVSTATYDSISFLVNPPENEPHFVRFKPDGTKLYFGGIDTDRIRQYSLSTPWDVSTATSDAKSFLFGEDPQPREVFFKPDGTKLYMLGGNWSAWFAYSLSTAWDVSTITYDSVFFVPTLGGGEGVASFYFKSDGTKVFTLDLPDKIRSYTLSTPWNIATASYDSIVYTITYDSLLRALAVKPDGSSLYTLGAGGDVVSQHAVTSAWDLSTIQARSQTFNVSSQETASRALTFKEDDGTKMYVAGLTNRTIYRYSVASLVVPRGLVVGSMSLG